MHQLQPFNFDSHQVRVIQADDGEPMFVVRDIVVALEYSDSSLSNLNRLIGHVPEEWKGRNPIPTLGGAQSVLTLTEQGLYFFVARSDKPKALPFQKWLAGEVLPSIRKTGQYQAPGTEPANTPATLALVECAANLLRASDSGKVVMLRKAGQAIGADTSFLPDYTEDSAPGHVGAMDTASATQLLRDHQIPLGAAKLNQVLEEIGILERRTRRTTRGDPFVGRRPADARFSRRPEEGLDRRCLDRTTPEGDLRRRGLDPTLLAGRCIHPERLARPRL